MRQDQHAFALTNSQVGALKTAIAFTSRYSDIDGHTRRLLNNALWELEGPVRAIAPELCTLKEKP